jgi:hypothetical protein
MQKDFRSTQERFLREVLAKNASTAFGLDHGFASVGTVHEFQSRVPIRTYDELQPYVQRVVDGEWNALTADRPFMFTTTSGTTSVPKRIPVTEAWQKGLSRIMRQWIYQASLDHPRMFDHRIVSVVSPAVEGTTPKGTPVGSMSGFTFQRVPRIARRQYAIPYEVMTLGDYDWKYWMSLRLCLETQVSLVVVPNASTIIKLGELAVDHAEQLFRGIHDGTVGWDLQHAPASLQEPLRDLQAAYLRPNPSRSRELQQAAARRGSLRLDDAWPSLRLVACWLGGTAGRVIPRLRRYVGEQVPLRELGFRASEGTFTIPQDDGTPSGVLTGHENFFEFIPEEESDAKTPRTLLGHELEAGRDYRILITHNSGLYRYDINDIVRCDGFSGTAPRISFVRKGQDMVNITGEKLHVNQVLAAEAHAAQALGRPLTSLRLIPDVDALRYDLLMEVDGETPDDGTLLEFCLSFDAALIGTSEEYASKRKSHRLLTPRVCLMKPGWSEQQKRLDLASGKRDGQYKWPIFRQAWDAHSQTSLLRVVDRRTRRPSSTRIRADQEFDLAPLSANLE